MDDYRISFSWTYKNFFLIFCLSFFGISSIFAATNNTTTVIANQINNINSVFNEEKELFIQFSTPSVSQFVSSSKKITLVKPTKKKEQDHALSVDNEQNKAHIILKNMGIKVLSTMRVGANGFRIKTSLSNVKTLLSIPGVISVTPIESHSPSLTKSIPWIKVPQMWQQLGSGKNITIAVIDSGIDYLHANFGGSGNADEYTQNDKTIIEPGSFPTAKVIGGYDFAGASYNTSDPLHTIPVPDPDPLDVYGHGSHVAGIAAGLGVPGKMGPGVAKEALLYAYKVFGDELGTTNLTADAIERALDPNNDGSTEDHVDVINLSLGGYFGGPNQPSTIAVQNAVELGVIVVVAAGNDGDTPYVLGSPGNAPDAITVASSVPGPYSLPAFHINSPAKIAGDYAIREANFTKPLSMIGTLEGNIELADPLDGCSPLINGSKINGKIVFFMPGSCPFDLKASHAQNAGAIGFITRRTAIGAYPGIMPGNIPISIPGFTVGSDDGELIVSNLLAGEIIAARFDKNATIAVPVFDDSIAFDSSRGPARGGSAFKPDLTAPGVGINSANVGTGTNAIIHSGTSMATPHVTGLVAILRSKFPDMDPTEIKAMLQNATVPAKQVPNTKIKSKVALTRQGTGVVRADKVLNLTSFVKPAGLSFGRINPVERFEATVNFTINNISNVKRNYSIEHLPNQTFPGIKISGPGFVSVSADGEEQVEFLLEMDPSLGNPDLKSFSQTEVDGWFIIKNNTEELRVGYIAVIDPASQIKVSNSGTSLIFENNSSTMGIVNGFTLAGRQGLFLDNAPNAIKYFGYRTHDYLGNNKIIQFGISTELAWDSLSAYQFYILIDSNNDGINDKTLTAQDNGLLHGVSPDGYLVTAINNNNQYQTLFFANADLNDNTAILSFLLYDEPGIVPGILPAGDTTFSYTLVIVDPINQSRDIQYGKIDLANEIKSESVNFTLQAGQSVTKTTISKSVKEMLWLFKSNQTNSQSREITIQ